MAKALKPEDFPTPHDYSLAVIEAHLDEKVEIMLPKDNENYKNDVTVTINGKIWLIQRGVLVKVPRRVAQILHQSQSQLLIAEERAAKFANVAYGER